MRFRLPRINGAGRKSRTTKAHSSGHHYMTLKDRDAAINAVMFRSDAMRLKFRLENGMKVIVRARVSSFPRTGAVQLYMSRNHSGRCRCAQPCV